MSQDSGRETSGQVSDLDTLLLQRRATIDVLPRGIEDQLLRGYALAQHKLRHIDDGLDKRVAELREQIHAAHVEAKAERKTWTDEQAGAIYQLSTLGRTEFELAELFDIPVTQVEKMIRKGSRLEPPLRRDEPPPGWWTSPFEEFAGVEVV